MAYDIFGVNGGSTGGNTSTTYKTNTATKNAGKQYDIFNIGSVQAVADPNPKPVAKQAPASKPQSTAQKAGNILTAIGHGTKQLVSSATTGEQKFSQGIARVLPGGTNDLKAEQQSSQVDEANLQRAAQLKQQGKINQAQYQKLITNTAQQASNTSKEVSKTEKSMPTKTQIALGAASTAADIATAGTFSKAKEGVTAAKVGLTSSKLLEPVTAGLKYGKTAEAAVKLGSNATAAGLNAGAGGGSKSDIIKNAAAGAVLPEALGVVGHVLGKGVGKTADALHLSNTEAANDLIKNQKVQTLLEAGQKPSESHVAAPADYTPSNAKVKTLMESQQRQQANLDAPAKQAAQDQASAAQEVEKNQAQTQKIDRQMQLIKAKGQDSESGLSNVDKTKLSHLQEDKQQLQTQTPPTDSASGAGARPIVESATPVEQTPKPVPVETASKPIESPSINTSKTELNTNTASNTVKTSGSALGTEARAVQRGLAKEFTGKAQYNAGSYKTEAAKAVDLVKSDPQKAIDIATGKTPADNTIHEVAVSQALERNALQSGDTDTLLKLAQSSRHTVTSEAAQRLGAEGYDDVLHSPVKAIKRIADTRAAALERKTGTTASKATSDEIKQIRAAKASVPKPTKETFASFVDSLKC